MTTRTKHTPDPRCWWCHAPIAPANPARGYVPGEPIMPMFPQVTVVVCGGACPAMPAGAEVGQHPTWWANTNGAHT